MEAEKSDIEVLADSVPFGDDEKKSVPSHSPWLANDHLSPCSHGVLAE